MDADGFFAAVEQALDPALRGRPVVTGAERGIIAAASYEAKALGIKRGVRLGEAVRLCPGLAVLPSDYEAYGLYLRHNDYDGKSAAAALPLPTCHDCEATPALRAIFDAVFETGAVYRSTTVWLGGLEPERGRQLELFGESPARRRYGELTAAVDRLNRRYGRRAVAPAALLDGGLKPWHPRDAKPERYGALMGGETGRHLAIPRMTPPNPV